MRQPKEQRFQLFLHEMHEPTAAAAEIGGRTLSSEVRHRVKATFELAEWLTEQIEHARGDRLQVLVEVGNALRARL